MRITSKGQVTIPQEIREKAGLFPNTEVEFIYERGEVWIVKAKSGDKPEPEAAIIARRRGRGKKRMTTDEIMALTPSRPEKKD